VAAVPSPPLELAPPGSRLWKVLSGKGPARMESLLPDPGNRNEILATMENQASLTGWNREMVAEFVEEATMRLGEDPPSEVWRDHLHVKIAENEIRKQWQEQKDFVAMAQTLPEAGEYQESAVLRVFEPVFEQGLEQGPFSLTELDERIAQRERDMSQAVQSSQEAHMARMVAKEAFFDAYLSRHDLGSHI